MAVVGNKPTSINTISALRIKSFITTFLIIYPNPKIEIKKNTQTPTGIMISTKKKFRPLGKNQRQPSPSLTNQTLCVYEHFKLQA